MSSAADHVDDDGDDGGYAGYDAGEDGWYDDHQDRDTPGVLPADVRLLDGAAPDALFGLERIREVPAGQVPPAVMVQAVLAAQRLASWAKAQSMYWTAALARPDVAVPVCDVLESIGHRGDEPDHRGDIPEDLAGRAAAVRGTSYPAPKREDKINCRRHHPLSLTT